MRISRQSRFQGCQMVYFQTKPPSFGTFRKAIEWKILISFKTIRYTIVWPFDLVYGNLVYCVGILI
jgi:hypothetical protein